MELRMRSFLSTAIIVVMAGSLALTGCSKSKNANGSNGSNSASVVSSAQSQGTPGPKGKYGKPIVLNVAKVLNSKTTPALPNGDDAQNNQLYKYIESKTNVQVKNAWVVENKDTFSQKLTLAMADRKLPDAFIVGYDQLTQLVKAGMVADLTNVYDKYTIPLIKSYYKSFGGRALEQATFNGKLMALPSTNIGDQFNMMWIRQDWLDNLGLKAPKTMADLMKVAKAFTDDDPNKDGKKDTYAIEGEPALAGWNSTFGFDPIFGAEHAYKGHWMQDSSGNPVYSSILPQMKTALGVLRDMYAKGYIDPQFAVQKSPKAPVVAGKIGIVFGPWWTANAVLADSVKQDPKADWVPLLAPVDDNGKFNTFEQNPTGSFLVVRKGYAHPEAVARVLNWEVMASRHLDPDAEKIYGGKYYFPSYWPLFLQVDNENVVYQYAKQLQAAWQKKDPSGLSTELKGYYDKIKENAANPRKDPRAWSLATSRLTASLLYGDKSISIQHVVFFGQTKTMDTKWATLQTLENETFLKIIMGQEPLSSFDTFVTKWKKLGGDQITQEVTQALKAKK